MSNPTWLPSLGWDDWSRAVCITDCVILDENSVKADHLGHVVIIGAGFAILPDVEESNGN